VEIRVSNFGETLPPAPWCCFSLREPVAPIIPMTAKPNLNLLSSIDRISAGLNAGKDLWQPFFCGAKNLRGEIFIPSTKPLLEPFWRIWFRSAAIA